ncbi:MAG TPA: DUF4834 family protein [Flavobacteriaceae bacterium]|nr:DUF4834 family protein [Flavobacteriaceae bacterium]
MITFLQIILTILLIYYGLRLLFRFLLPYFLKFLARKAEQKMEGAFRSAYEQQNQTTKSEGEVSVDKMPRQNRKSKKTVGEYVDYEEID